MKMIIKAVILLICLFQNIDSKTIQVPQDVATIQAAIDSSAHGDTLLVSPGIYLENINFNGKNIVLGSLFLTSGDTSYISQTIIDGNQQGCVVVFEGGEDSTAVLSGFTITNGLSDADSLRGGGITCTNSSSPKLTNLIVENNSCFVNENPFVTGGGGILCVLKSSPTLQNIQIQNNNVDYGSGGGVLCRDSSAVKIIDSKISKNSAHYGGGFASRNSSPSIEKVEIIGNKSKLGGGLYFHNSNSILDNSIIKGNSCNGTRGGGGGIIATDSTNLIITNSQITNNSTRVSSAAVLHQSDGAGIYLRLNSSATIENCKINYNYSISYGASGGGICVRESYLNINNSEIIGNSCGGNGSGVCIYNSKENILLEDVVISHNYGPIHSYEGGGLYYYPEHEIEAMKNVIIKNNSSSTKGGGLSTNNNLLITESSGCSIFLNRANKGGADIHIEVEDTSSITTIYLDTTTVSNPDNYHIDQIKNINLYYNHAIFQSVDQDLYVSPNGSDLNNGTSKDESLKTINFALLVVKFHKVIDAFLLGLAI